MKTVDILLLNYNGENIIDETLQKIYNQKEIEFNVYVFDNGSTDKSREIISRYNTVLLGRENNGSFTSAYNELYNYSNSNYCLILSNDVKLENEYTLKKLIDILTNIDLNIVGIAPRSIRYDGNEDQIKKPELSYLDIIKSYYNIPVNVESDENIVLQDSCLLIKRNKQERTLFDEKLKFYYTEDYLCDKLRKRGRLHIENSVTVSHAFMYSTRKKRSSWQIRVYYTDMIVYCKIKYGLISALILLALTFPIFLIRYLKSWF